MTLFRIYVENGFRTGFWVQHRSWSNRCAQVRTIAGQTSGALPGVPPLHADAQATLEAYDVRSGRPVAAPVTEPPADKNFSRIAEPSWYTRPREEFVAHPGGAAPV